LTGGTTGNPNSPVLPLPGLSAPATGSNPGQGLAGLLGSLLGGGGH
jgi:hypothetical protein